MAAVTLASLLGLAGTYKKRGVREESAEVKRNRETLAQGATSSTSGDSEVVIHTNSRFKGSQRGF